MKWPHKYATSDKKVQGGITGYLIFKGKLEENGPMMEVRGILRKGG